MSYTVKIRNLILGDGVPKICVPIVAKTYEELENALLHLRTVPFDLVEFRADHFSPLFAGKYMEADEAPENFPLLTEVLRKTRDVLGDRPLLFTVRTAAEGGEVSLSFPAYAAVLTAAARTGLTDLIDVELLTAGAKVHTLTDELHDLGTAVIGSSHDFKRTPPRNEMRSRLLDMQKAGMDIGKLAVMPLCRQDVAELIDLSCEMADGQLHIPFVTMSMGSLGVISRVCGKLSGSAITFASAGRASAPGQIDAALMRQILDAL